MEKADRCVVDSLIEKFQKGELFWEYAYIEREGDNGWPLLLHTFQATISDDVAVVLSYGQQVTDFFPKYRRPQLMISNGEGDTSIKGSLFPVALSRNPVNRLTRMLNKERDGQSQERQRQQNARCESQHLRLLKKSLDVLTI